MIILSFYTSNGIPQSGLIPTIDIADVVLDTLIVDNENMSGLISMSHAYKYDFTIYDDSKTYAITVDGGSGLIDSDRYQFASNENNTVESGINSAVNSLSGIIITSELNIKGEDSDTLKTLSDEIENLSITITPVANFHD